MQVSRHARHRAGVVVVQLAGSRQCRGRWQRGWAVVPVVVVVVVLAGTRQCCRWQRGWADSWCQWWWCVVPGDGGVW